MKSDLIRITKGDLMDMMIVVELRQQPEPLAEIVELPYLFTKARTSETWLEVNERAGRAFENNCLHIRVPLSLFRPSVP